MLTVISARRKKKRFCHYAASMNLNILLLLIWNSIVQNCAFVIVVPQHNTVGRQQQLVIKRKSVCSLSLSTVTPPSSSSDKKKKKREPSKVVDTAGPTPVFDPMSIETIDVDTIPELKDIRDPIELNNNPISYQPWRRGELGGCDDPITAEWRRRAEEIIYGAIALAGGVCLDVTWYLTTVLITIDDQNLPDRDFLKSSGPVIDLAEPSNPLFYDPNDPDPEEIWGDEDDDEIQYIKETPEEAEEAALRKQKMFATKDPDLDDDDEPDVPTQAGDGDTIPTFMNEETRSDMTLKLVEDEQERYEESEQPVTDFDTTVYVDTAAISTIAKYVLDALRCEEETLQVLARHEIVLAGPCPAIDIIETQKQFNAARDQFIIVQTIDPFQSNRILKGKLIDRNSMDLMINKKGRMVTIPLNFVQCVRLATPMDGSSSSSAAGRNVLSPTNIVSYDDDEEDDDDYNYSDEE